MNALFVYITASDDEEATRLGRMLVDRRLAACVNILGPIRSIYRWEGSIEQSSEVAFIAKTTNDRLEELTQAVRDAHSYDEPCVAALPVTGGSQSFINWIVAGSHPAQT